MDEQPPPPPPPPPSSAYSYITQQAIKAGCRVPGSGRASEYFNGAFGRANEYFQSRNHVRESIQRELEKEMIREEIIAAEVARRQELEVEVRREMMIERELALRAGGGGRGSAFDRFSFLLGGGMMGFEPREVPFRQNKKRLLEERIAMSLEERLGMEVRRVTEGFEMVPFQRGSVEPKTKEVTPSSSDVHKQKDKIVILAKPDASLSRAKRKAVPPEEKSAIELLSNGVAKKKVKEEWSCALCQVTATSEHSLNDHIEGKKHKSKEAAFRAQSNGNNIGIGVLPKEVIKPAVEVTHNLSSELGLKSNGEMLQFNQAGKSLLQINLSAEPSKENIVPILQESDEADNLRKKNMVGVQKANKKGQKKKKITFWCEMCQVGAYHEKVMEAHRKGKKHMTRIQEARENGKTIRTPQIVGVQVVNDADEAAKEGDKINVEDVDGATRGEKKNVEDVAGATKEGKKKNVEDVAGATKEGDKINVEDVNWAAHQEDEDYRAGRRDADCLDC